MEIDGKVAVVSGAASGIGRAAVLALAVRGAKVVVADVDEDGGRQTVEMAGAKGGTAAFRRCDVTKTEDLGSALDWAVEHLGRFDIPFNNAGISGEDLFADEPGHWARIIDINLTAVIDAPRCPKDEADKQRRRDHQYRLADRSVANGQRPRLCCCQGRCGQLLAVARVPGRGVQHSRERDLP
jgi:15-hydroxyprostaglandin dehydrogenase (NAD)